MRRTSDQLRRTFFSGAAIQLVERLHRVLVLRVLGLLLACGISAVKDAAAMRRDLPCAFSREHVRIAPPARRRIRRRVPEYNVNVLRPDADTRIASPGTIASNTSYCFPCDFS